MSLPLFLRSHGAGRVHGDVGVSHALRLLSAEVGLLVSTTGRPPCRLSPLGVLRYLLSDKVGPLTSTTGRLRWLSPLGVGNAEDPRELGRVDATVDSEEGVFTPGLVLSSLSQLQLRTMVPDPGNTLVLDPKILLRMPIAGCLLLGALVSRKKRF